MEQKMHMEIRTAEKKDVESILRVDRHIEKTELESVIALGRVMVAEKKEAFIGWLRWGLFWDNTPFMNLLFLLEEYRHRGFGKEMVLYWENQMRTDGYGEVLTSTRSDEPAQHFYRKLGYVDCGALLLPGEPLELIFLKKL